MKNALLFYWPIVIALQTCIIISASPHTASASPALDRAIRTSRERNLGTHPAWLALGHYKTRFGVSGWHSLVDDPEFFLSASGSTNPQAELEETLTAFFKPRLPDSNFELNNGEHPLCVFPARAKWLRKELGLSSLELPHPECRELTDWIEAINATRLTLIFPTAYLNNPASMFGHTLLRLDSPGQNKDTRLLAYGANFAAATTDLNGFVFALKGIFGGYRGFFSIQPYYEMVKKYSDLENRDIWEYELNFTPDEVDTITHHLWEMRRFFFDYYFFDENCSYHLLTVLETARPDLGLSEQFNYWAIPNDTVRAIVERTNLVKTSVFRPAHSSRLRSLADSATPEERSLALSLARGEIEIESDQITSLSTGQRARVLELAFDALTYFRVKRREDTPLERSRSLQLLNARSRISAPVTYDVTPGADRPENGHRSRRLAAGSMWRNDRFSSVLKLRPAFHDLLSPDRGFVRGAQIRFLDATLRITDDADVRLEELSFVDIVSLSPRSDFFKPLSWNVRFSTLRKYISEKSEPLVLTFNGGAGVSIEPRTDMLLTVFFNTGLDYSGELKEHFSPYAGPGFSALADISQPLRLQFTSDSVFEPVESEMRYLNTATMRISLGVDYEMRLSVANYQGHNDYWNYTSEFHWFF